jgi:type VI protein secretion system component VasK
MHGNLVLILVLLMTVITLLVYAPLLHRAVFCPREEPMQRLIAFIKVLAGLVAAVTEVIQRWRQVVLSLRTSMGSQSML